MPSGTPIQFGAPDEWALFAARHADFLQAFPRLMHAVDRAFRRDLVAQGAAAHVVFAQGRLAVEDFMEILLVCGNGYGVAGLKLLRAMFERTVTALYLSHHPNETEDFLDYHYVHRRRLLSHARDTGINLREHLTDEQIATVERNYQRVRGRYTEVICQRCGTTRDQHSWSKRDLRTLASSIGLERAYVTLYFWPMLMYHTTVSGMDVRFRESADGLSFRWDAQLEEADYALTGAHTCLLILVGDQNRYFRLGLNAEIEQLQIDFEQCWPGRTTTRG